jgi:Ser/Thr protein kinase RdoA (MazF antagonist)
LGHSWGHYAGVCTPFLVVMHHVSHVIVGPVQNDGNDHNIILDETNRIVGIIDFGDMCVSPLVVGFAVALSYGLLM